MRTLLTAFIGLILCSPAAAENSEPLPTFAETCFQARPAGSFLLVPEAQRMLEATGPGSNLSPGDRGSVRLNGLFRVRDWTPESTLRVALDNPGSQLRIHAWGEGHGVSLFLTAAGAAYRITQQPSEAMTKQDPRLTLDRLVTTDDRRGFRLPHGAYQVRCQDGAVVVTKGNVRLLTAPLEGTVKSLYIEVPTTRCCRTWPSSAADQCPKKSRPCIGLCSTACSLPGLLGRRPCPRARACRNWATAAWNSRRRTPRRLPLPALASGQAGPIRGRRSNRRRHPRNRHCLPQFQG